MTCCFADKINNQNEFVHFGRFLWNAFSEWEFRRMRPAKGHIASVGEGVSNAQSLEAPWHPAINELVSFLGKT